MVGEFEIYLHNEPEITTVTGFLKAKNSIAGFFKNEKPNFLAYDGETGISNLDRIWEKYTETEQEENTKDSSIELLKPNTELIIPKTLLEKELSFIRGKNQFATQKNFNAFYGESLVQMLKDPLYTQKVRYRYDQQNTFTSIYPHISVWIYVGSLDVILNISSFIMNCNISNSKNGGSFNFSLPPMVSIKEEDLYEFGKDEFYSSNNMSRGNTTQIFRNGEIGEIGDNNEFYFHKVIQANDIVFIKFEELEIEEKERPTDFILNKSVLSRQIYDMIGLVDVNSRSTNFGNNDVTINISGRNFMKLLIDDGSYFFPLLFVEGGDTTFINSQDDKAFIKRNFFTGKYDQLFSYSYRSISDTLMFIMNQLANLGVIDEKTDLFSSYVEPEPIGERRTKIYRREGDTLPRRELHKGVWQIIKLLVDDNVKDRRLSDSSASQPNSSLIDLFNKFCQTPFVEFFIDNYGDFTNFIVRQPPWTKSQIQSILNGIPSTKNEILDENEGLVIKSDNLEKNNIDIVLTIEPEDVISDTLQWENDQIYSWYQLDPRRSFFANQSSVPLAYLPIIYFPQYANKWGNRRFSVVTNYTSHKVITGNNTEPDRDKFKEAVINDYKYLLDSHVYLPFTRKGSITINGDRRFKIGTWIRYKGTGEIFYLESVSHNFNISSNSIDRTTTLQVSRGMIERYAVCKDEYKETDISYFNIVNTSFIKSVLIQQMFVEGGGNKNMPKINTKSNFLVNQSVFDFFYERKQFE